MYVFLLFDYYCQARIIIIIAFFQVIAISWIYGKYLHITFYIDGLQTNIKLMPLYFELFHKTTSSSDSIKLHF